MDIKHEDNLEQQLNYRKKLLEIVNRLHANPRLNETLYQLQDEITGLFGCERITLYIIDAAKKELVSCYKSHDTGGNIHLPINAHSIAGYAAYRQQAVSVNDAYNQGELEGFDPKMSFFGDRDKQSGFKTKQVLAVPIIFKQYLFGVIQFLNKTGDSPFDVQDEQSARELAGIIGIALYNNAKNKEPRPNKYDYLLQNHIVTKQELEEAIKSARKNHLPVENVLIKENKVAIEEIGQSLAQFYKVPFAQFDHKVEIPKELLKGLKLTFLKSNLWVPLGIENDEIVILIDNPNDLRRRDVITGIFSRRAVKYYVALREDILNFIAFFYGENTKINQIDRIMEELEKESGVRQPETQEKSDELGESDSAVVQLVNRIILDAYERKASDIHVEPSPEKEDVIIRIRIDGDCVEYRRVPHTFRNAIVSRIKIMANLDITERRKPQDGKIKFEKLLGKSIELRVATIPTQGDVEDVVMRILAAGEPLPLEKMGFSRLNHERLIKCIENPYGIVFVCGPTGSGKTTTLHSILKYLNRVDRKIWTAEDPVEITQKGLRQVQVRHAIGFDFAAAMRSFLRADPDIIMVGEMRDKETTHIGIEASLTGHLVFSTLHTNSAPESVVRLLDMGMDPFNFADAVLGIMAQRLVRTLCALCKEGYHPDREEFDQLVREYDDKDFAIKTGVQYDEKLVFYRPKGCKECHATGYRGRMGIHELLTGTDPMKKLIQSRAPVSEIRFQAIADGMRTLKQDGIEKVLAGHCDLLQVRRVCIK